LEISLPYCTWVSLTSIVCKIMESIIRDIIVNHFLATDHFSNKQYGFIKGIHTEDHNS